MVKSNSLSRICISLVISAFLNATLLPNAAASQEPGCESDKKSPPFARARKVLENGADPGAESESNAVIKNNSISYRPAAQVMPVNADDAMIDEDLSRTAEESAEEQVDKATPLTNDTSIVKKPAAEVQPRAFEFRSGRKPWYKKWWAMVVGVGLVATVAVVAGGGGSDEEKEPSDELPPPPDRPSGK